MGAARGVVAYTAVETGATSSPGNLEMVSIVTAEALSGVGQAGDHDCHGESDSVRATAQRPAMGAAGTVDSAASAGEEREDRAAPSR